MRNKGFAGVALSRACVCFEEYCCAVKERNFVKHLNFVRRKEKGDTQESNLHSFMDEIRLPSTSSASSTPSIPSTPSTSITNQIFCLLSIDRSLHWDFYIGAAVTMIHIHHSHKWRFKLAKSLMLRLHFGALLFFGHFHFSFCTFSLVLPLVFSPKFAILISFLANN